MKKIIHLLLFLAVSFSAQLLWSASQSNPDEKKCDITGINGGGDYACEKNAKITLTAQGTNLAKIHWEGPGLPEGGVVTDSCTISVPKDLVGSNRYTAKCSKSSSESVGTTVNIIDLKDVKFPKNEYCGQEIDAEAVPTSGESFPEYEPKWFLRCRPNADAPFGQWVSVGIGKKLPSLRLGYTGECELKCVYGCKEIVKPFKSTAPFDLTGDSVVCIGETGNITAEGGEGPYEWTVQNPHEKFSLEDSSDSTVSFTSNIESTDIVTILCTDANGCENTISIKTVHPKKVRIVHNNQIVEDGGHVTLCEDGSPEFITFEALNNFGELIYPESMPKWFNGNNLIAEGFARIRLPSSAFPIGQSANFNVKCGTKSVSFTVTRLSGKGDDLANNFDDKSKPADFKKEEHEGALGITVYRAAPETPYYIYCLNENGTIKVKVELAIRWGIKKFGWTEAAETQTDMTAPGWTWGEVKNVLYHAELQHVNIITKYYNLMQNKVQLVENAKYDSVQSAAAAVTTLGNEVNDLIDDCKEENDELDKPGGFHPSIGFVLQDRDGTEQFQNTHFKAQYDFIKTNKNSPFDPTETQP